MKITVHRGTHQIGGVATEISSEKSRIIIDMGDELSLDPDFVPRQLDIPGVTDSRQSCHGILFTHNHGDHIGQYTLVRDGIPLYMGELSKKSSCCPIGSARLNRSGEFKMLLLSNLVSHLI